MQMKVLSKEDVRRLVDIDRVLETVEKVYVAKAQDRTVVWPTVFHEWEPGFHDMDIKSGYLKGDELHGIKTLTFSEANVAKGLPNLVGVIVVFDTATGAPLAMLDAALITGLRTGCAGAVGAKYLARRNPTTLFVLGTGNQAFFLVGACLKVFPTLEKVYLANPVHPQNAVKFASTIAARLSDELKVDASKIEFVPVGTQDEMAAAVGDSQVVMTATPSRTPVIRKEWVRPGTHFSCIGADMSGKEEIDPALFSGAVVFADDLSHTVGSGEMEIPLRDGYISESDLKGEIGSLILGECAGRTCDCQTTIYDACGMALLDIATAKTVYDLAVERGMGQTVEI